MRLIELQRLCRDRLRQLSIPTGTTPEGLVVHLSRRRGRPLDVLTVERPAGLCGVWVAYDRRDVVYIDRSAAGVRSTHILLHELAHIALDHDGGDHVLDPVATAGLFPDLDLATVRAVLGRGPYTSDQERQAEVLAWLLQREVIDSSGPASDGSVDNLLSAAFDARPPAHA